MGSTLSNIGLVGFVLFLLIITGLSAYFMLVWFLKSIGLIKKSPASNNFVINDNKLFIDSKPYTLGSFMGKVNQHTLRVFQRELVQMLKVNYPRKCRHLAR